MPVAPVPEAPPTPEAPQMPPNEGRRDSEPDMIEVYQINQDPDKRIRIDGEEKLVVMLICARCQCVTTDVIPLPTEAHYMLATHDCGQTIKALQIYPSAFQGELQNGDRSTLSEFLFGPATTVGTTAEVQSAVLDWLTT